MRTWSPLVLLFAVLAAACTTGGQLGDQRRVRFSQIVNYAEATDFSAPVAVGATLFVGLELPSGGSVLTDPPVNARLDVRATPVGHDGSASVAPLGFAQYAVVFDREGSWRLEAIEDGAVVDTLMLTSRSIAAIRFARELTLRTVHESQSSLCVADTPVTSLDGLVLHANQLVLATVVPTSSDGTAMLGLLGLTASGSSTLSLTSTLVSRLGLANQLNVAPAARARGAAEVTIRETRAGLQAVAHFEIADSAAPRPSECP